LIHAGALSSVYLLPGTQAAVIVLSNTLALCDAPDWIAQHVVEVILDSPKRNDFVDLADKAAKNSLSHHPKHSEEYLPRNESLEPAIES
jgi:hypothetical protein